MTTREQIITAAKLVDPSINETTVDFADEDGMKKLEHFYAIAFEAGAASRDNEIAELQELLDDANKEYKGKSAEHGQIKIERDQLRTKLAAEQAKNVELRRAFIGLMQVVPREVDCGNMHHKRKDQHEYDETCPVVSRYAEAIEQADKVLAAPSDPSALEAIVKKAGEVMRERCRLSASSNDFYVFSEAIRAIPAVTLEDLK